MCEIKIIQYTPHWRAEFLEIGAKLRGCSGNDVLRIDHIGSTSVPGLADDSPELKKQFFREPHGERRTHIHVRASGRENQRYALLFRDYLRNDAAACQAYADIKYKLAA